MATIEIKNPEQSYIEMDSERVISLCENKIKYIDSVRLEKMQEFRSRAIAKVKEKLGKWYSFLFSKELKNKNDDDLFKYMLKNFPRSYCGLCYKMEELNNFEHATWYGNKTKEICETLIDFSEESKNNTGKLFISVNDYKQIIS